MPNFSRWILCLSLASAAPLAWAQSALEVVVLDTPGGRALASTKVTLSNPETGFSASGNTDSGGKLLFPALNATGAYVASVVGDSGQTVASAAVRLRSNFTSSVTLTRAGAGGTTEEVTVEGERAARGLNFTNAEISASLDVEDLNRLPVEARDLASALFRLPGVTRATSFFPEAPQVSINGANSLFTQYLVDGLDNNENFLGGQKFPTPIGIIRDVTVLTNSYSVEYGRTANGIVNVTTKSGTNEFKAEPFFLYRPGNSIDASQSFASRDLTGNGVLDGFKRYQGGFAVSGPIVRDQTFFFADVEVTKDEKDNRLTAPTLGANGTISGDNRFNFFTARVDHRFNDTWSGTVRLNRGDVEDDRQGGGLESGLTFPSAGDVQTRVSNLSVLQWRYNGDRFSYVGDLQFASFDWNYGRANTTGPQTTLQDMNGTTLGVVGNNGFFFDSDERTIQTKQKFLFNFDRVRVNAGVDIIKSAFDLRGGGNPNGNYTVRLRPDQLAAVRAANRGTALNANDIPADALVTNYAVELRPATFGTDQRQLGLWTEAAVDVTDQLTTTLGVRYDYDDLTKFGDGSGDKNNVAPRLGLNYRFSEQRSLRFGAGLFYEKLPYTVISDAIQRNADTPGFRQQLAELVALGRLPADTDIDRIVRNGNRSVSPSNVTYLQGPTGAALAGQGDSLNANERQIFNPDGYDNPYSFQTSLGFQQSFARNWLFESSLQYSRGHHLLRLVDVNAPTPYEITAEQARTLSPAQLQQLVRTKAQADATRPTQAPANSGRATGVVVTDTGGKSDYRALVLGVTKERGKDVYALKGSFTLSRAKNNTDDINFRASNANLFDSEYGPSLNDRKRVLSATAYLFPLPDVSVSLTALLQSGQPVNFGPDGTLFGTTDLNGDGISFADQYTGNPDRAPGFKRNSGRLPSTRTFDLGLQYSPELYSGVLELRADVFNLFNEVNLDGYAVNATVSNQFQTAGQSFLMRSADRPRTFQFGARYLF
jgi:hypothetical protein